MNDQTKRSHDEYTFPIYVSNVAWGCTWEADDRKNAEGEVVAVGTTDKLTALVAAARIAYNTLAEIKDQSNPKGQNELHDAIAAYDKAQT